CRFASHHFPHLPKALGEMARVVKAAGAVILEDTCAPEAQDLAEIMNRWELKRDPSHVANHPPSRLRAMLEACGLSVDAATMTQVPQEFRDWARRGGVSDEDTAMLRTSFLTAPPAAQTAFRIENNDRGLRFAWPGIVVRAIKSQSAKRRVSTWTGAHLASPG